MELTRVTRLAKRWVWLEVSALTRKGQIVLFGVKDIRFWPWLIPVFSCIQLKLRAHLESVWLILVFLVLSLKLLKLRVHLESFYYKNEWRKTHGCVKREISFLPYKFFFIHSPNDGKHAPISWIGTSVFTLFILSVPLITFGSLSLEHILFKKKEDENMG